MCDPIGLLGGINTFGYVNGNPLSLLDPLGLRTIYRWPGNNYGDVPPPGVSCEEAIFSGGILTGWKPCQNQCSGDQPMPRPSDYGYDGWPTFARPSERSSGDGYSPGDRPDYWSAASAAAGTWSHFPGILGCVFTESSGTAGIARYLGCGVGVGGSSIRHSWQNTLNFGDPTDLGVRGNISGGFFGGAASVSAFLSTSGLNLTVGIGRGGGGTGNVTIGYRRRLTSDD